MNFALPALVILLALLPGIVFGRAYYSGRFARRIAGITGGSEAALYVLMAIPIDLTAARVSGWFGYPVDWATLARFIFGTLPDEAAVSRLSADLKNDIGTTALWYVATIALSVLAGSASRRLVWATRLDLRVPLLRMKNEWFYQLLGRRADIIDRDVVAFVDVLASHPDGSRLYRGIVSEFEISDSGALQQLTLNGATRGKGRGEGFKWAEIPGDGFIILGSCVHSINITYVALGGGKSSFWRRFLLEER